MACTQIDSTALTARSDFAPATARSLALLWYILYLGMLIYTWKFRLSMYTLISDWWHVGPLQITLSPILRKAAGRH